MNDPDRNDREVATTAAPIEENVVPGGTGSGHQRCHERHHHVAAGGRAANATQPLQIHDLVSTTAAIWVFKDRQKKEPPTTTSRDEYLKVDAAADVTELLWSWAPLIVIGARRACVHDNETQNCTEPAHAPPQCQLVHGTVEVGC